MASLVHHVSVDCADTYRLGTFWAEVLGTRISDDDQPGGPEALVEGESGIERNAAERAAATS
ncbi:VOC family protein [Streptomyces sp. NBC_00829]|uniref:VOC family protein n=1 Tax=Streptomyces sp. NBC_00829 TaxID=2903679 RepID=UPI003867B973|nr:hypothetical protein OG293_16785 [Streptomyces sp. NBC_00829]